MPTAQKVLTTVAQVNRHSGGPHDINHNTSIPGHCADPLRPRPLEAAFGDVKLEVSPGTPCTTLGKLLPLPVQ